MHDVLGLGHLGAVTACRAATGGGSLTSRGYQVTIVQPMGSGELVNQVIDPAELHRDRPYAPGGPQVRAEAK